MESTDGSKPIQVLIADDSYLIREGLAGLLAHSSAIEVVGTAIDVDTLLKAVAAQPCDVVLTDMRMPPTHSDEGMQIAEHVRQRYPTMGVVVLSQHANARSAARLLESGATRRGYLHKDRIHDLDGLVATIKAVARGECSIDAVLVDELLRQRGARQAHRPLDALTPRQREILADIAAGKSNAAIARDRELSLRATEKHVSEIFARLGLASDEDISRRVRAALLYLAETVD
jgi:DNA-binding NarL/FixJ family response regulator